MSVMLLYSYLSTDFQFFFHHWQECVTAQNYVLLPQIVLDGFLSHVDMIYSQVCELNECKCIFNKTKQNRTLHNKTK